MSEEPGTERGNATGGVVQRFWRLLAQPELLTGIFIFSVGIIPFYVGVVMMSGEFGLLYNSFIFSMALGYTVLVSLSFAGVVWIKRQQTEGARL